jgi:hypothetical protein
MSASLSTFPNAGIPVKRIPFLMIQNSSWSE